MRIFYKILIPFFVFLISSENLLAQELTWKKLFASASELYYNGKYNNALEEAKKSLTELDNSSRKQNPDLTTILNKLAEINIKLSKYQDAKKYCDSAIGIIKSSEVVDSLFLAVSLNNLTEIYYNDNKYSNADSVGKISLAIKERVLRSDDPEIARSLNNLGELNRRWGKYNESEKFFKSALSIREKSLGIENYETGQSYNNLANLYYSRGNYSEAENLYKKALLIRRKTQGAQHPDVAITLNSLAVLFTATGKFIEAEDYAREALKVRESVFGTYHVAVAISLQNLAQVQMKQGKYVGAEQNYKKALTINEKVLGPMHPNVASNLNSLAGLYMELGKYCDAEPMYIRSLEIREKTLGPKNPEIVKSLINLGQLYSFQNEYSKGEAVITRALGIFENIFDPEHPEVARLLTDLAFIYDEQKRYQEAEKLYKRAIAIQEKKLGLEHPSTATTINNLASLYYKQNNFIEAELLYKKALSVREKILGPNHPDVLTSLHNLACLYAVQKRFSEADTLFDKDFANINKQFEQLFDYASEQDKMEFLDKVYGYFPEYFTFAWQYLKNNPRMSIKMMNLLLWQKGIVVSSTSELVRNIMNSGDKNAIKLLEELKSRREKLAKLNTSALKNFREDRAEIDSLEKETQEIENDLSVKSVIFNKEKTLKKVKWNDIQNKLKGDEAAVEFVSFKYWQKDDTDAITYYCAIIIRKEMYEYPEFVLLGTEKELLNLLNINYCLSISQFPYRKTLQPANKQYRFIWGPIEKYLKGVKRVYLSPDGLLNQFSFGVLMGEDGRFLIEKYEIRYVSNLKDILRESNINKNNMTAVLLGNPKYLLDSNSEKHLNDNFDKVTLRESESAYSNFSPLPELNGTEIEVKEISKIFSSKNWKQKIYLKSDASEDIVKDVKSPRVLHLATHGFFLTTSDFEQIGDQDTVRCRGPAVKTNPMYHSGLFFAGADDKIKSKTKNDGIFNAYEASNLDLSGTELVVLSACQTGLGDIKTGEGVFGLRRAFQIAGAEAVVMSLWSVPDQETEELMVLFYKKWLDGKDKYAALQEAQNEMREIVKKRYGGDNPFYWGAFVMIGR